jgi:hypothetical protein
VAERLTRRGPLLVALAAALAFVAILALGAGVAHAEWKVHYFHAYPSTTQAGGHPNLRIEISTDSHGREETDDPCQCNDMKNADVELPAGFIGNPHAAETCSDGQFIRKECPSDSQIGVVEAEVDIGGKWGVGALVINVVQPLYNMVPKPNQAGLLAWRVPIFEIPIFTELFARTGSDYGLDANTDGIEHIYSILSVNYELWGVPSEPIHNTERDGVPNEEGFGGNVASDLPPVPFLQNPTSCTTTPQTSYANISSYEGNSHRVSAEWPRTTGCDQLSFNPSLSAQPTTTDTDSPSGLEVDLSVPQELSPVTPSPSEIRALTTTLPEGFSINPNAADGKTACHDVEAKFGTTEEAQCPDFAKIGSASILSSALPGALPGSIYIGEPLPGNRYRMFLTADGFATHIKLAGSIRANPITGQITTTFEELPQSPLTEINLHFFGSERGILATPTQCGTYPVTSVFTPWDEQLATQSATQLFTLTSGPGGAPCPPAVRPFNLGFKASSLSNQAGTFTPFSIELTRPDGDQNLAALAVSPPPGLLAKLAGIPYCSDAAIEAAASPLRSGLLESVSASCPAASRIGTAVTGAGAGDHPVYLSGSVYLAGPYKGAPLSLVVITPAVSGPYDLGDVVVRAALRVNPVTAQITAVSDPLPHILEGIPLRLRSVKLTLDRPGFTVNPTDCKRFAVDAAVQGDQGAEAHPSAAFQTANCASLPFGPKVAVMVKNGTRLAHPAVHAEVTAKSGEAAIASAAVTLPHSEFLDNAHIKNPCTRVQFAANQCPATSVLGTAKATTPLLEKPLEGPVYLRSSNHKLPDLVAVLKGQIEIELDGRIDTLKGGVRTTFETVPDAPITKFDLDLKGGKRGLLINSENVCKGVHKLTQRLVGQNGAVVSRQTNLETPCGSKKPRAKRVAGHARKAAK